ncbi:MAG TPA: multiheme c-type cytochrome [Vicinamibacterales bacterium]|nr:multiheme c-type cytochrome [Vicinamibacterales bacterium]
MGPRSLIAASLVLAAAIALSARPLGQDTPTPAVSAERAAAAHSAYLGSSACRRCHEEEYASWRRALHLKMTRGASESEVLGDFSGRARLEKYGRSYAMSSRGDRRFITVTRRNAEPETFEVHYTLGARRFQGYLSRLPDGRIYVLPAFWHVETAQWVDFKEITPLPDDDHDYRQIWNVNCFNCHATNLAQNFNQETLRYETTWTEMGVSCEACHGPGRDHVALAEHWEKEPASKPAYDNSRDNSALGPLLKIFSPRTAPRRQIFDACGYCHGNKTNFFAGFKPGDRYEDYALPFLISEPIPPADPQGDFWPDGRPTRFNRPQALMTNGCFMKGQAVCTDCHLAHGARNDHALKLPFERSNGLCTQCHAPLAGNAALTAHTRHPANSAGSRCVECHMSDVNWRLLNRRRDHTFAPPVPELTARYGVPNACTTCHDARTPEWAARTMDEWYGSANRARRTATIDLSDAMYRAGSGDRGAIAPLTGIVTTRSLGAPIRASAAEFLGRLAAPAAGTPAPAGGVGLAALNALAQATTDPEPIVRAQAVRALTQIGDRRAAPVFSARLRDQARVVRVLAASGLLDLGVTALDGPAQTAFQEAQQEYERSLRTFRDSAPNQVLLGILLARQGRYDAAIEEWEQGRRLDPSDPRFGKLIAAAKQRR